MVGLWVSAHVSAVGAADSYLSEIGKSATAAAGGKSVTDLSIPLKNGGGFQLSRSYSAPLWVDLPADEKTLLRDAVAQDVCNQLVAVYTETSPGVWQATSEREAHYNALCTGARDRYLEGAATDLMPGAVIGAVPRGGSGDATRWTGGWQFSVPGLWQASSLAKAGHAFGTLEVNADGGSFAGERLTIVSVSQGAPYCTTHTQNSNSTIQSPTRSHTIELKRCFNSSWTIL